MNRAILLLCFSTVSLFAGEQWPGVQYAEVRAYAWPGDKGTEAVILSGMTLMPGVINKDGALLTHQQVKRLLTAVSGKHPSYSIPACHLPHNAFMFYDAAKKPVAYFEICFECFNKRSEPQGTSKYLDLVSLASIFAEHKLPMGKYSDVPAFKKHFAEWDASHK